MSKEVKRYSPLLGLARNAKLRRMEMQCDPQWVLDLFAERDAMKKDAERYRWLCEKFGVTKLPCAIERILAGDVYVADGKASIDAAIDAAMQGEQP